MHKAVLHTIGPARSYLSPSSVSPTAAVPRLLRSKRLQLQSNVLNVGKVLGRDWDYITLRYSGDPSGQQSSFVLSWKKKKKTVTSTESTFFLTLCRICSELPVDFKRDMVSSIKRGGRGLLICRRCDTTTSSLMRKASGGPTGSNQTCREGVQTLDDLLRVMASRSNEGWNSPQPWPSWKKLQGGEDMYRLKSKWREKERKRKPIIDYGTVRPEAPNQLIFLASGRRGDYWFFGRRIILVLRVYAMLLPCV